jgi:hypothetical protein
MFTRWQNSGSGPDSPTITTEREKEKIRCIELQVGRHKLPIVDP